MKECYYPMHFLLCCVFIAQYTAHSYAQHFCIKHQHYLVFYTEKCFLLGTLLTVEYFISNANDHLCFLYKKCIVQNSHHIMYTVYHS